jgi:hypothetical protein
MKFTFAPESRPLDGYTIKRAIYRGGFGEVYYGVTDAGRDVALKLLQNNSEVELRGVQQCLNLSHPNLVTIFDIRKDQDGDHWIIMEYVPGETLDAAVRLHPQGMPMQEVRRWLHGICAGVAFLHERGLVHRDLKPANVFSSAGGAKVGDVGLSKFISPSKQSAQTQSVGTVYYMAPEVAQGRYGKEVDVYAMGVILYEMLTGQVPFDGESTGEILMKHLSQPPDLKRLPERLRPVLARALAKDPAHRYASIIGLQRAFDDAVVGRNPESSQRVSTQPPRTERSLHQWRRSGCRSGARSDSGRPAPFPVLGRGLFLASMILFLLFIMRGGGVGRGAVMVWGAAAVYILGYGVYALGKALFIETSQLLNGRPRPTSQTFVPPRRTVPRSSKLDPDNVRTITARERWRVWTTTGALAPLVAVPISAGLARLQPALFRGADSGFDLGAFGFFAGTAVLATWVLSGISAWFEGTKLESVQRRGLLALGGGVIGLGAAALGGWLLTINDLSPLIHVRDQAMFENFGDHQLLNASRQPSLLGFVVFFAALAGSVRWWRQSSDLRAGRFRVAPVLWSTLIAFGLSYVWPMPREWTVMWAAVMSATLQIASPWTAEEYA